MTLMCSNCREKLDVHATDGYSHVTIPLKCVKSASRQSIASAHGEACPLDPYVILPDQCTFVDSQVAFSFRIRHVSPELVFLFLQTLKLQEAPETIPTGELPRHVILSCERCALS
jgi:DNA replication licensing factor MCM5